jgi:hypothetical protein
MLAHSMKKILTALILVSVVLSIFAADEPEEILLWPDDAPGSEGKPAKEIVIQGRSGERSIYGVHRPSITPFLPTKESPPAFLACAFDDRQDISEGLADLYLRFKRAGVRTELHIYSTGGHGFGVRESNQRPVGQWTERFFEWMKESGFVAKEQGN